MQKRDNNKIEVVVTPQMSAFQYNVYTEKLNISQHADVRHQHSVCVHACMCACLCKTGWNSVR